MWKPTPVPAASQQWAPTPIPSSPARSSGLFGALSSQLKKLGSQTWKPTPVEQPVPVDAVKQMFAQAKAKPTVSIPKTQVTNTQSSMPEVSGSKYKSYTPLQDRATDVGNFAKSIAVGTPARAAGMFALSDNGGLGGLMLNNKPQGQYDPNAPMSPAAKAVSRFVFGDTPVKDIQGTGEDINQSLQGLGLNKDISDKVAIPAAIGLGIADVIPGVGGAKKKFAEEAGKTVQEATATQKYLAELKKAQEIARGKPSFVDKTKGFLTQIKTKMVDSAAPIEDALSIAEKRNKFQVRPSEDVRLQIDRVLRAKSLASQFAEDNGLVTAIRDTPDLHSLDQYMIAKQAARVQSMGIKTGRDAAKDAQLITDLAPQYEPQAQQVSDYSRKLLDYATDSGLVDSKVATTLKTKYPEYVPLQRIFSEIEQPGKLSGITKGKTSLSKQTVVQALKGSEREIESPIESLVQRTQTAFEQGEKNKAGRMLASYKDLPGLDGLIRPLKSSEKAVHTFSYLDNGIKKTFETTPEIAAAAKNLNQEQLNIIMRIISIPTRLLQLGATGLNIPFVATNLLKDQVYSFVNTNKALSTSILNPGNFLKALYSAVKHDDLYEEVIRNAGTVTSYDIARQEANLGVKRFQAGKNIPSKIKFIAKNPPELLRAIENIVGRAETLTRIQQYKGSYDAYVKAGRTVSDAKLLAAKNAREATANFSRSGDFGKVANYLIPFFNAGIQGARSFMRAAQQRPGQTAAKTAISLFMPMTAATLWNTTDPARRKVYEDIPDYEKQSNIILIPDNPTQDEQGRWNVIKIPMPPGLSNLASIVRNGIEQTVGVDELRAKDVLTNLIAGTTSLDISSGNKIFSTFTPQILKPGLETLTNTNLYTGKPIVPYSMKDLPPEAQKKEGTSPLAIAIGKVMKTSPLLVENYIKTSLGGVGGQVLGEDAIKQIVRRFSKATGGELEGKEFDVINEYKQQQALEIETEKGVAAKASDFLSDPTKSFEEKRQLLAVLKQTENQKVYDRVKQELKDRKTQMTSADRAVGALGTKQQAAYIATKLKTTKTREEKVSLLQSYKEKGLLSKEVIKELKKQMGSQ